MVIKKYANSQEKLKNLSKTLSTLRKLLTYLMKKESSTFLQRIPKRYTERRRNKCEKGTDFKWYLKLEILHRIVIVTYESYLRANG